MHLTRKQMAWTAVFTALAAGGIAIGSTLGGGTTTSAPPSTPVGTVNPLTGKPGKAGGVLVVKIDNVHAARPALGLSHASIVYAIEVEGGLSRLAAVFDTNDIPPVVGPVRSARETDLQLVPQYGHPAFAFSGAQSRLLPVLKASDDIAPVREGFFRRSNRPAPHNEYLNTSAVRGAGKAKNVGLRFAAAVPDGGRPGLLATVRFPAARFGFLWESGRYRVLMDGAAQPWRTDNVIIQKVRITESQFHSRTGPVPFSHTVGSGIATVYRDGKAYACTWSRGSVNSGTAYKKLNGDIMKLKPGNTWIVLAG